MRIFGIEFNTKPKSTTEEIISLVSKLKRLPGGIGHKDTATKLQFLCLQNPSQISDLVFSGKLNTMDTFELLFTYSSDHWGSCNIQDNPIWSVMMREYIIPNFDKLDYRIQAQIQWFQRVHEL